MYKPKTKQQVMSFLGRLIRLDRKESESAIRRRIPEENAEEPRTIYIMPLNVATMGAEDGMAKMVMINGTVIYVDPGYISLLAQVGASNGWAQNRWISKKLTKQAEVQSPVEPIDAVGRHTTSGEPLPRPGMQP